MLKLEHQQMNLSIEENDGYYSVWYNDERVKETLDFIEAVDQFDSIVLDNDLDLYELMGE